MESSRLPFIKKFKVDDNYYIYDVNTNEFFKVDELVSILIDKSKSDKIDETWPSQKYSSQQVEKAEEEIGLMKKQGFFSSHRPQITFFHRKQLRDYLVEILENRLAGITLALTEKCNMRCKYCAYSGHYYYHRTHGDMDMSEKTMKDAVDFYFAHSNQNNEKHISFYGGEPLANFALIKKCVGYVKNNYPGECKYNMTINGTLLDEEKIEFLEYHNFSILISLDGPAKMHDRYRVFGNGKGTFDKIMKNLKLLKAKHPGYYRRKIRFNMVLAPPYDFASLNDFISTDDTVSQVSSFSFATVSKKFNSFFERFDLKEREKHIIDFEELVGSFNQKLFNGTELGTLEKNLFRKRYYRYHRRNKNKLPAKYPSHGQCTLGEKGVFVNADGKFNFCSQVEEVYLGNIYDGFDIAQIERIYFDLDEMFARHCYDCWAIRFCSKCIKEVNENGKIDKNVFGQACKNNKASIGDNIASYLRIRENNYHAFDYLNDITYK